MKAKKFPNNRLVKAVFGGFFAVIMLLSSIFTPLISTSVYAEPVQEEIVVEETNENIEETAKEAETPKVTETVEVEAVKTDGDGKSCKDSLGAIGWIVCPATGKVAEAVDWMYEQIRSFLVIDPVEAKDGQPIYEVWKYFRGLTNVIFIIFLLIVIYSQITGLGITNYGVKRALPKLIVMAVLVNLSFLICSVLVDVSNIVGEGIKEMFESIEAVTVSSLDWSNLPGGTVSMSELFEALSGGLLIGGTLISFTIGSVFMLLPIVLGAVVAVASGLITIALRQALVALLIMIAPLALVANILPNTEPLFKKWKALLTRMLVFYPVFSLLFGASHLAGFAIIAAAKNGFWVFLGVAVQIFPLFFSWKLMEMSGTMLSMINAKMRGLAEKPLSASRTWAESHKNLANAKQLAKKDPYSLPTKLKQALSDRQIARDNETKELNTLITNRGLAFGAKRNYNKDGTPSKEGEEAYERVHRNLRYQSDIERDKHNMNKGLGQLEAVKRNATAKQKKRLDYLDAQTVLASDKLKFEVARGEKIEYNNAKGFYDRMEAAVNAHFDKVDGYKLDANGNVVPKDDYTFHFNANPDGYKQALKRYNMAKHIMEGEVVDVQYAAATAAQGYDTQMKIITTKFNKYFDMIPPSEDLTHRMREFSLLSSNTRGARKATDNMDAIIAGLRVINQRGDTDVVKDIMNDVLDDQYGGLEVGTHASQALASFLMFEVKDSDPFLRRFGKYINLETARAYNKSDDMRKEMKITYDEYLKGYHIEPDGSIMHAKKDVMKLMEGTSLENIERTALASFDDSLKKAYGYEKPEKGQPMKPWKVEEYLEKRKDIQTAFEPAFLSAGMKWMSGSEQINSGVKFWMGYEMKPKTQDVMVNGKMTKQIVTDTKGNPIYEPKHAWDGPEFAGHEKEVRDYYQKRAVAFCNDQTTAQILGMRTDFREPLVEHLLKEYLDGDGDQSMSSERIAEYNKRFSDIQTKNYGPDLTPEEIMKKRDDDVTKLKREFSGRQLRKILDKSGKLKQIYQTRTSGTAVNAKDWLRKMVGLDDEDGLRTELTKSELDNTKKRISEDTVDAYYSYTHDLVKEYFGEESLTLKKYERVFEDKKFQAELAREKSLNRNHSTFYNTKNTYLYDELNKILNNE